MDIFSVKHMLLGVEGDHGLFVCVCAAHFQSESL